MWSAPLKCINADRKRITATRFLWKSALIFWPCGSQCNVSQRPAGGNRVSGQFFTSAVQPRGRGGSAHSLVIKVLVMSHEVGVGGGWDREIKRKKEKERERRCGLGRAACFTSRCPLTLPGGWQISTVWPWICLLCVLLPGSLPVHLSTAHIHSEHARVLSIQAGGQFNRVSALNGICQQILEFYI